MPELRAQVLVILGFRDQDLDYTRNKGSGFSVY